MVQVATLPTSVMNAIFTANVEIEEDAHRVEIEMGDRQKEIRKNNAGFMKMFMEQRGIK